jgi:hypothetical protein
MGSHGGATPSGQLNVLAEFGVTPESTGVSFDTSMDVDQIGTFGDSNPIVFSRAALQADAIIIINRIKPHTDFFGFGRVGVIVTSHFTILLHSSRNPI